MSDISHWTLHDGVEVCLYDDHVAALLTQDRQHMERQAAAVAEAKKRTWDNEGIERAIEYACREGRSDAIAKAAAAVQALIHDDCHDVPAEGCVYCASIIAAIKGVSDE